MIIFNYAKQIIEDNNKPLKTVKQDRLINYQSVGLWLNKLYLT